MGNGDGGLTASFRERAGLKGMGFSDAMSTSLSLDNIIQHKEDVSF
jgi:hypothetical protein